MLRINEIRSDHELNTEELYKKTAKILGIRVSELKELHIIKKSLDARRKNDIKHIYAVAVSVPNEEKLIFKLKDRRVSLYAEKSYSLPKPVSGVLRENPPVVVGFGPAGMFAALCLSYAGLHPLILERGDEVEIRAGKVKELWDKGILDTESNVQFGEGGAGTFSDGKLNTGIRDKENRNRFVLKSFVKYGASEAILTDNKPHIGSDVLRRIVKNIRCDIIDHGGSFRFRSRFTGYETDRDGLLKGIYINDEEFMSCERLILAIGHSARDTFEGLRNASLKMEPKSFAVGIRVQHLQEDINRAMYGEERERIRRNADYKLTFRAPSGRGVYSFCMCPGGYVVNSSSEDKMLCINGMSYSGRDGLNANSAIVVTVSPSDYTEMGYGQAGVLSGMEFQRELERRAFSEGRGMIPCQRLDDFRENRVSYGFGKIKAQCKGGYSYGNIRNILPDFISSDIISAFSSFGQRIRGFDDPDSLLSGVESRTSSPVRILRNENFLSSVPGIFPAGEGAGYAGGIMSAAIDGLKCAEALLKY